MDIKKRILELRESINALDSMYEKGENTILNGEYISDSDYDKLYIELEKLEKENPQYKDSASPTQKLKLEIVKELKKVEHTTPMLSQEKITDEEGVLKFLKRSNSSVLVQDKLDGLTIFATYNNGKLIQAVTRGNGFIGEDVTHNYKVFTNVPLSIPFKDKLEVRLEAMVPYKEFHRINVDGRYSNPRNLASGTVRQLDSNIAKERGLIAIAFDLISAANKTFKDDLEMLSFLKDQGFEIVNHKEFKNNDSGVKELLSFINKYEDDIRPNLPFMVDGLVLKFNNLKVRDDLGYTSKFPKWATAYKFESEESSTKIIDIVDQVGKTGQITPVAILDSVEIGDVNISRATLHNYTNIKTKDIRIGDTVIVARANDVIPQVVKSLDELRSGSEKIKEVPEKCPACGSIAELNGENLFCTGINCEPQLKKKIEHYASRNAMNIKGLGEKAVDIFFHNNIINNLTDIYQLKNKKEEVCQLEGFGPKKFENIVSSIEESKNNPLNRFIYGLSINNIGEIASKALSEKFKSMDNIIERSKDKEAFEIDLRGIKDFGDILTMSVLDFFENEENIKIIEDLAAEGVSMKAEEVLIEKNSTIADKTFVITGKVDRFKNRKEIKELIESYGGKVVGSVSSNTDYLVNNDIDSSSSKNKKAKELNIPIIGEDELLKMLN